MVFLEQAESCLEKGLWDLTAEQTTRPVSRPCCAGKFTADQAGVSQLPWGSSLNRLPWTWPLVLAGDSGIPHHPQATSLGP